MVNLKFYTGWSKEVSLLPAYPSCPSVLLLTDERARGLLETAIQMHG